MGETFTAPETRGELHVRLVEAMTSDDELGALVAFLRDDLAYAPTNDSTVGGVLREREFEPWRRLMIEAHWDVPGAAYSTDRVRELSSQLLREMEAA